jgi:hypothetical protein
VANGRPRVFVTEPEDDPGPLGEQVAAAVRDFPQLGDCGLGVERFPPRVAGSRAGDAGACDSSRVGLAAGDGHVWTVPLFERTFCISA